MDTTPTGIEQEPETQEVLLRSESITDEMRREFHEMWRFGSTPRRVPETDTPRTDKPESEEHSSS